MKLKFLKQDTEQRRNLIVNGPITKTILLLSLPSLMMGIVQSIIPLIDGLFINNVSGTIPACAVTYCVPIIGMIIGLSQGLGSAGMAIIGQANGKGDLAEGRRISTQMVIFSSVLGVVLAPLLYAVAIPISAGVTHEISHDVFLYLALNTFVIPFSFLESIYNAIKNANGKPEATFVRMVILLVLKVIFNALFVALFKWSVTGAAMSSLAANFIITVWMYIELFIKKGSDRLKLSGFRFDWHIISSLIRIGFPAMLANLMIYIGFFLINNEVEIYGPVVLNGQGIASNISSIAFTVPSSFASAVTTMVSMNVGAGHEKRARMSCWAGCLVSAISAGILIALIVPLAPYITVMFTREAAVLEVANRALHIYTFSVVGFGVCMVQIGAFIGLGRTWRTLILGVLRIWLLRYLFILATERVLGVESVFWGNLFSNYACAVITTVMIFRVKWVSVIKTREHEPLAAHGNEAYCSK
jgi:putative MATE family efflux protein